MGALLIKVGVAAKIFFFARTMRAAYKAPPYIKSWIRPCKRQHESNHIYPMLPGVICICHEVLCVDATHGTNVYGFKLNSNGLLMNLDRVSHVLHLNYTCKQHVHLYTGMFYVQIGYPVAWCIADQENTDDVLLLFQSMKEHSPSTEICVLISDDGKNSLYA